MKTGEKEIVVPGCVGPRVEYFLSAPDAVRKRGAIVTHWNEVRSPWPAKALAVWWGRSWARPELLAAVVFYGN
jgi:hypothetical protein